jgi:hypothetical protein
MEQPSLFSEDDVSREVERYLAGAPAMLAIRREHDPRPAGADRCTATARWPPRRPPVQSLTNCARAR